MARNLALLLEIKIGGFAGKELREAGSMWSFTINKRAEITLLLELTSGTGW